MQVHVRALFACDAPRLTVRTDADGGTCATVDPDETLSSVRERLFDGPVLFVDRHGIRPPLHWPLWLFVALDGNADDGEVPLLYFVDVRKMRATTLQTRMTVVLRDVHLFHTPEYADVVRWIVNEAIPPIVLPKQTVTRVHKDCVCDDTREWTMAEWLDSFPRAEEDAIDVVVTHEDARCALAHAGSVLLCLPHKLDATFPSTTASPVVPSRKRKA